MARIEDIAEGTRQAVLGLQIASFENQPFVGGPPLARRRVAVISSAALHPRGSAPFLPGTAEMRLLAADLPAGDIVMSHVSINYDRTGWQRDINTIYPLERLRELATAGVIGSVADTHYAVMGSTDPATMQATAAQIVGQLQQERSDAVLLSPV